MSQEVIRDQLNPLAETEEKGSVAQSLTANLGAQGDFFLVKKSQLEFRIQQIYVNNQLFDA